MFGEGGEAKCIRKQPGCKGFARAGWPQEKRRGRRGIDPTSELALESQALESSHGLGLADEALSEFRFDSQRTFMGGLEGQLRLGSGSSNRRLNTLTVSIPTGDSKA